MLILNTEPSSVGVRLIRSADKLRQNIAAEIYEEKSRIDRLRFSVQFELDGLLFPMQVERAEDSTFVNISAPPLRAASSNSRATFPIPPTGTFHSPVLLPMRW